jgi:hypothetical protein
MANAKYSSFVIIATILILTKVLFSCDNLECTHITSIATSKKKKAATNSKPKKKSISEQVDDILMILPEDELKDFLRSTCLSEREFRIRFLTKFAHIHTPNHVSKSYYVEQIHNLFELYSGRYGFIEYREASKYGTAISEMLDIARSNIEKGEHKDALPVIFAVLEEVTPVLNSSDDSNGYIGGCIEEAIELMGELVDKDMDEGLRKELFNQLITTFESTKLDGWDWNFNLISFAIQLVKNSQEEKQIKAIINDIKPTGKSWDWNYRRAQELMQELLSKTGTEEAVTQYLKENIANPDFRERLIKEAIKANDYKYALELTNDGISKDSKEFSGLANKWREYQLDIYQKQEDNENIIRLARYFAMNGNGYSQSLKYYYDLLKSTVPTSQWSEYLEKMIDETFKKGNWTDYDRLASFFIWEQYWDRYLTLLQKNTTLSRIQSAEEYLKKLYCLCLLVK